MSKRKYLIIALVCCLAAGIAAYTILRAGKQAPVPEAPGGGDQPAAVKMDLHVDEFGVSEGRKVTDGFVFVEGRYLDAPYVVTRRGLAIFINGEMVRRPLPWPPKQRGPLSVTALPRLPASVTRDTLMYDKAYKDYERRLHLYLRGHLRPDARAAAFLEAYRKIPCVKEVKYDPARPNCVTVTLFDGNTYNATIDDFIPGDREEKVDKQSILERVERTRTRLEEKLARGDCYFFSKGGHFTFSKITARKMLPPIVRILRSDEPDDVKFKKLQTAGHRVVTKESFDIVTNFSASPQLEQRMAKLQQGRQ